jgi:hypothetical protein
VADDVATDAVRDELGVRDAPLLSVAMASARPRNRLSSRNNVTVISAVSVSVTFSRVERHNVTSPART